MGKPLLEVSSLAPERDTVVIKSREHPDGKLYELATVDDLSVRDQQYIYAHAERVDKLLRLEDPTENEKRELEMVVDKFVTIVVLELPDEVRNALPGMAKVKLLEAFTLASPELAQRVAEAEQRMSPKTTSTTGS